MTEPRVERRLAAILAADVVGYSRLMEADEEGTLAALQARQSELIAPKIAEHRGRIVKTTGDGVLVEFASVVDAVRCAIEVQEGMAARNAGLSADKRLDYRIGINLGDVMVDGTDIYGDGVNIAARLETLAEPGGIYLSASAHDQVKGKVGVAFEDLGAHAVKNIAEKVRVYRVALGTPARPVDGARPALPLPDRPSIAVLPFQNMSGDPEQEYFSDGITEDIITDLSKISGLFVIARNSTFAYKGRTAKVPEVARELGVAHVVEGSVRKAGNRVRVTAQLIDGPTGGQVWAERYDRELVDVFAVQDELTREIVAALKVRLTPDESARVGTNEVDNVEAYDLVLRATEQHYRVTPEGNAEAHRLIERALAVAPGYARAYALLANNHIQVPTNAWGGDRKEMYDRAYAAACKAVDLDPGLALAHQAKGFVALWRRQFDEAIGEIDRAVTLEPNDAASQAIRAVILAWAGDSAEAVRAGEAALRHDPLRSLSLFNAGLAYYEAGRFDAALAMFQRGVVRRPDFLPMFLYQTATLARLGRKDEARRALQRILEINPKMSQSFVRGLVPYRDTARLDRFVTDLAEAGMRE